MTYRERRERRAERLRGWAAKRETQATGTLDTIHKRYAGDHGFNFQPGHIPERARVIARQERAFESLDKAASMSSRASGIESQLERAIYDDDPDAIEALRARLAELETRRERLKTVNAAIRKVTKGLSGASNYLAAIAKLAQAGTITAGELEDMVSMCAAFGGYHDRRPPTYSYTLTNLSGNISRNRERLARLERRAIAPSPNSEAGKLLAYEGGDV